MLQDGATYLVPPMGHERGQIEAVSEILDEKFGRVWRVAAIPVFALCLAVLALVLIAMANALAELL